MTTVDLKTLQQEVSLLRAEGKYKETIEACYNLLNWATELNDYKAMLTAHINSAASFYCIGAIEEAFQSIESYDEICIKYGDEADALHLYNVLFLLYDYNKDYEKAKETLSKSIELGMKLEKFNIVSNGYSNLSHVCLAEGNYLDALAMASKGLEMAKLHEPQSRILELRVTLNIAQAYIGLGNQGTSKQLIDEIVHDPILDSFIREKSQAFILQGNWLSKQKLYKEAFESYSYAKELVESYNDVYLLKVIQEERSNICEKMQDIQLGYKVQKEYISLLNEINERELALTALKLDVTHNLSLIEKKANTDYLTGLYNRNHLETVTNDWLRQAYENDESIVCIVFDIDNFKSINDKYGHLFGDEVIKEVARTCSSKIDDNEMIGRYGGDEFVIVLKNTTLDKGKNRAEKLEKMIRNLQIDRDGSMISITSSIGVTSNSNGSILTFNELFHEADVGLYRAKKKGKNQIYVTS
ncbi:tetratricopeptide repeat-containing diguanylate cyclase [Robertmurraya kyonggiensis]|uniref:GGDEF domain-containing protein n=1 Tax=Robertmurraya kyonggiensis TaxID=1037680 RepID=A0A4U1D0P9_9BACI|nr:tetratricopeptide repeat-containing diguanylate cyclase [Robertmurraya kyonggiensis]TKC15839.1 GGDEF domain-containing protein [Robertmurraya kyonggiensis]